MKATFIMISSYRTEFYTTPVLLLWCKFFPAFWVSLRFLNAVLGDWVLKKNIPHQQNEVVPKVVLQGFFYCPLPEHISESFEDSNDIICYCRLHELRMCFPYKFVWIAVVMRFMLSI